MLNLSCFCVCVCIYTDILDIFIYVYTSVYRHFVYVYTYVYKMSIHIHVLWDLLFHQANIIFVSYKSFGLLEDLVNVHMPLG